MSSQTLIDVNNPAARDIAHEAGAGTQNPNWTGYTQLPNGGTASVSGQIVSFQSIAMGYTVTGCTGPPSVALSPLFYVEPGVTYSFTVVTIVNSITAPITGLSCQIQNGVAASLASQAIAGTGNNTYQGTFTADSTALARVNMFGAGGAAGSGINAVVYFVSIKRVW